MNHLKELFKKYDVAAPRYTSYPPVPYWENRPSDESWLEHLNKGLKGDKSQLDIYVHIPYCRSICHYCGCNRELVKSATDLENIVTLILSEFKMYQTKLSPFKINWLHLGGGTPTALPPSELDRLLGNILSFKYTTSHTLLSMEADPRVTDLEHLEVFRKHKGERISFGVQDFSIEVGSAIGRVTSPKVLSGLVESARQRGVLEINFDLVYGLPKQTEKSIRETFEHIKSMRPETIAFYSYAHVPQFAPNQLKIAQEDLPTGEMKRSLYELGRELLRDYGYIETGMDHFSLPSSKLYQAYKDSRLRRSFMGYIAQKSDSVLALGPSSISSTPYSYMQNDKSIDSYAKCIDEGRFSFVKGHTLTHQDQRFSKIIEELLCHHRLDLDLAPTIDLTTFLDDGIIEVRDNILLVTELGRPFIRNIAMAFDPLTLKLPEQVFSRSI